MTTTVTVLVVARRGYGTGRMFVKHGSYYGSWRIGEKRVTRKIGPVRQGRGDGLTKTEAEARLRKMIDAEAPAKARVRPVPTVRDAGEMLVERLRRDNKKLSYIESAESNLRAHINPLLGDLSVDQIVDSDIDRLVGKMLRQDLSPKTIRNNVGTLHSLLERARKDGHVESNPVDMGELPRVRKSRGLNFLTIAELERVLSTPLPSDEEIAEHFPVGSKYGGAKAVRDWWPIVRLLVLTASMTGMRLGELRGLRWRDLGGRVRVRESFVRGIFDDPKSVESSRAIPLADELLTELEAHHKTTPFNQESDLVLAHPHTGRPLDKVRLGLHFKAALGRAGVKEVRIHDLRHTFATTMAADGVPMRTIQAWLGHEDARTTQIYSHYAPAEHEAQLIGDAFSGLRLGADSVRTPFPATQSNTDPARRP